MRIQSLDIAELHNLDRNIRQQKYKIEKYKETEINLKEMAKQIKQFEEKHNVKLKERIEFESENNKIIKLDLSNMNLTEFPEFAYSFKNLLFLNISNNKLKILPQIENFPNLIELNARNNEIKKFFSYRPECRSKLRNLELGHNKIKKIEPFALNMFLGLKILNLEYNRIEKINVLDDMELKIVKLNHNKLNEIRWNTKRVEELSLQNNRLKKLSDFPASIKKLYLHNNQIKNINFLNHSTGESISIYGNPVKSIKRCDFDEIFASSDQLKIIETNCNTYNKKNIHIFHRKINIGMLAAYLLIILTISAILTLYN